MKILVIDDTGQIATILVAIEAEVVCITDEIRALNVAQQQQPELILLDYGLLGGQTPDYIRLLLAATARSNLVVIGEEMSEEQIFRCLLAGAKGYQEGRQLSDYIGRLIPAVTQGEAWLSRRMVAHLLDAIRQQLNRQAITA
ncbi:response regulator transcription factor [Methylomonas sp. LL1]|uniref:response regulator transcription factor n=1 Tax=Methylomonas sp. LL1 TaxID=2785785 RepID=UPI0018C3BB27|nr:response regulator transcription factor [Methylomonas sp. LL1]QPK63150.1 response regulator transcription factor [Methylomonas sp. LL1]